MGAQGFLNLSQEKSRTAYKKILENSTVKWSSAAYIAESGDYGTAISTAIVSVEELVKALIVAMNGYGFEFRKAPSMQRFFVNHQIRYLLAYAMFIVNVFTHELGDWLSKLKSNPDEEINRMQRLFSNDPAEMIRLQAYGILKFRLIKREFEWFEKVDIFRQEAMYSDFSDNIKSPVLIDQERYFETIEKLAKVRSVGNILIETLESKDEAYVNHFDTLKMKFTQEKYYDKIETAMKGMKKPNIPFESLRAFFTHSIE